MSDRARPFMEICLTQFEYIPECDGCLIQPAQINMAVFFFFLVKSDPVFSGPVPYSSKLNYISNKPNNVIKVDPGLLTFIFYKSIQFFIKVESFLFIVFGIKY